MRLAFISHSGHLTGGEKMLVNLATSLAGAGDADCLILAPGDGPMHSLSPPPGCRIMRLHGPFRWYLFVDGGAIGAADHLRDSVIAAREIEDIIRDWGAELVVVNTLTCLSGLLAAAELNLPCVTWAHGIIDSYLFQRSAPLLKAACDEALLRCAARLVVPSRWTADFFERALGTSVTIIPNGTEIPESITPLPAGLPTFSCLNTLDGHKGMETLIDAALLLRELGYEFRFRIYGDGTYREVFESRVQRLDLGEVVRFCGRTIDVATVYRTSHALVTAAEIESFGLTLIEAMGHGRPVIVSDTSGHREIVDGPFGFRCPTRSAHAFAWHMARVIERPDEARRMGELGHRVARHRYSIEALRRRFAQLFSEILGRERELTPDHVAHRYAACRPFIGVGGAC